MGDPERALFVVVLTDDEQGTAGLTSPRAVGPFDNFDIAQTFGQTLRDRWETEGRPPPVTNVVRVESDFPGVVVGEL